MLNPSLVKNKACCRLWLDCQIDRPEELRGVCFDELLGNEKVASMLQRFDEVMSRVKLKEPQDTYAAARTAIYAVIESAASIQ